MKKYTQSITITLLVILLVSSVQKCSYWKSTSNTNLDALTDTVRYYKNALGTQTASIKTLQLTEKQLKEIIIKKDNTLKALASEFAKVKSVLKYKTVTRIDTVKVKYTEMIPCEFERSGSRVNKWYSFNYYSNENGIIIDSLTISNTTAVITGIKRKWLLGRQTITTDITNSNPYIQVNDIKSAEIDIPEPWYKKWYVWFTIGVIGGILSSN
ncbi:DUF6549 family protein [Flavobacterium sp. MK4S-17]|uniref:DUF6549 family protein n=1 Tax=Flavobacterium sp. MK4S-17 TaxID=2543737 RepID=UPI00135A0164|nr:DUF6549 family protein [Flavobacterium sp. MK4S-17]